MRLETYRAMSRHVGDTVGSLGVCNFRSVVTRHALSRINCYVTQCEAAPPAAGLL